MQLTNFFLSPPLVWAKKKQELQNIQQFRKQIYQTTLPNMPGIIDDPYDTHAYVWYSYENNHITSTARLVLDSDIGLPEDNVFPHQVKRYREQGLRLAEFGRLVIYPRSISLFKKHYQAAHAIACVEQIDVALIVMNQKHIEKHKQSLGVEILSEDVGADYCEGEKYACVAWHIARSTHKFF